MIRKPEDHDWRECVCTFHGKLVDGRPVLDKDGRIEKGDTKLSGVVVRQRYLGRRGEGLIPDFEIEVRGESGAVVKIGLLENNFQVVER